MKGVESLETIIRIASLVTAIGTISAFLYGLYKAIKKIDDLKDNFDTRINEIDKSQCKNYLVSYLTSKEKGEKLSEVETERAHECYEHYTDILDGNGYIKSWWNRLMKEGK